MPDPFPPTLARFALTAAEYAFAIAGGVSGCRSRFPAPADGTTHDGKGRLTCRRGWRFLHLEGSPAEIGRQDRRLLGGMIGPLFDCYLTWARRLRLMSRRELARRVSRYERHIPAELSEEMHGLAEGAGMSWEQTLTGQCFLDALQSTHCAAYAAWDSASAGGEMIFGRNLDFASLGIAQRCHVISFIKPDRGIPFISVGWPGWVGTLTAFNLRGLCLGTLNVNRLGLRTEGEPYPLMFRRMVQHAASCDEAVELLRRTPRTYPNNALICQTAPTRRAVVIEYNAQEAAVREAPAGRDLIISTNHFRKLGQRGQLPELSGSGRYGRMMKLLEAQRGGIHLSTPIFDDPRVHHPNSLHALVVSPERRMFRLAVGSVPAAKGPYRTMRYDEGGVAGLPAGH